MKKLISLTVLAALTIPATADAAWWKPSTWKMFQKTDAVSGEVIEVATSTDAAVDATPTIADLYKRIAELEDRLQEAQQKLRAAGVQAVEEKKAESAPKVAASTSTGLSEKAILAKVKPALVLVETATTSGSGVVIDAEGRILVPAHAVLALGPDKSAIGAVEEAAVTFPNGTKKKARLVGFDEARGAAVMQVVGGGSYAHVSLGSQSSVRQGDPAYIAGMPSTFGGSGGEGFVSGAVSRAGGDSIEVTVETKPLDNGGAVFDANGAFVGIPQKSSCKVLEDMKKCLKHSIVSPTLRGSLDKIAAGMRLYKDKKVRTAEEALVRGQIEGVRNNTQGSPAIEYAVAIASGKNSFDGFNSRLVDDQEGKITKLYLNKLKIAAQGLYSAMDFLENQAHAFNVFMINEERAVRSLGDYQKKVVQALAAESAKKVKEYEARAAFWSRKKNEYDTYLANPSSASHNYLLEEGAAIESELEYLVEEKEKVLEAYSGEAIEIF